MSKGITVRCGKCFKAKKFPEATTGTIQSVAGAAGWTLDGKAQTWMVYGVCPECAGAADHDAAGHT